MAVGGVNVRDQEHGRVAGGGEAGLALPAHQPGRPHHPGRPDRPGHGGAEGWQAGVRVRRPYAKYKNVQRNFKMQRKPA